MYVLFTEFYHMLQWNNGLKFDFNTDPLNMVIFKLEPASSAMRMHPWVLTTRARNFSIGPYLWFRIVVRHDENTVR